MRIHHVGFIVGDIDKAIQHFIDFYNVPGFNIYDFVPNKVWSYGKEVQNYRLRIAMSTSAINQTGIELIQPITGEGVHRDFLSSGRSGLHHVCISTDNDYSLLKERFLKKGYEFIFESETEDNTIGYRRCFYAQDKDTEMIIEIKESPYFRNK